jgi:hypothetical protein
MSHIGQVRGLAKQDRHHLHFDNIMPACHRLLYLGPTPIADPTYVEGPLGVASFAAS